jgi:hypothetical protein
VAAAALLLASCGGSSQEGSDEDLGRIGLTRNLPAKLIGACRQLQDRVTATVYCPPAVPRLKPSGVHYVQYAGPADQTHPDRGYEVHLLSGSWLDRNSLGHWAFFAGTPALIRSRLFPYRRKTDSEVSSKVIQIANVDASVKRMAAYPQGGVNGGHVLALWELRGIDYVVSLHGYQNEQRAVRMAEALIREIDACPGANGPVISGCE